MVTKKKMGRPKKNPDELKNVRVSSRITKAQEKVINKVHGNTANALDFLTSEHFKRIIELAYKHKEEIHPDTRSTIGFLSVSNVDYIPAD